MNFEIRKYTPEMKREWDAFVDTSRNATFLFKRDYIDYHSDRFRDASCLAYKGNRLMALLPANLTPDGVIHSHQGLTYGGWILPSSHIDGADLLEIFETAIIYWRNSGYTALDYKPLPTIYHLTPSQEDIYALYRLGANVSEVNLSMALPLSEPIKFNQLRRRSLAKASRLPITIEETEDVKGFMNLVERCLNERYSAKPVHTAEELKLLKMRFPDNIRFFILTCDDPTPDTLSSSPQSSEKATQVNDSLSLPASDKSIQAGVCIYDTGLVAHTQYIATTPFARKENLLTPLIHRLITDIFSTRKYFDFGTSNQSTGPHLNAGLLRQKASFGATGVAHLRYHLPL